MKPRVATISSNKGKAKGTIKTGKCPAITEINDQEPYSPLTGTINDN
jgi:hypothetical protein